MIRVLHEIGKGEAAALKRSFEAVYTDAIGREVFRELLVDPGCGMPEAVRHRDGRMYQLIAATAHRAVYRMVTRGAAACLGFGRYTERGPLPGHFAN